VRSFPFLFPGNNFLFFFSAELGSDGAAKSKAAFDLAAREVFICHHLSGIAFALFPLLLLLTTVLAFSLDFPALQSEFLLSLLVQRLHQATSE
jgi:hypothetical protein